MPRSATPAHAIECTLASRAACACFCGLRASRHFREDSRPHWSVPTRGVIDRSIVPCTVGVLVRRTFQKCA
ncbi:hypothetical protein OAO87_00260 [bacterium]|nr:hypothetical protein [bacterium]